MDNRITLSNNNQAHFITTICYKRRRLLYADRCKGIVISMLASQLEKQKGHCLGFVIMPDHVHVIIYFPESGNLSYFMKQWKQRSSFRIKRYLKNEMKVYSGNINEKDPVWQRHYYSFDITSEEKCLEKLRYIHGNPVRKGLVDSPALWRYGSAQYYELGMSVGVPVLWPG